MGDKERYQQELQAQLDAWQKDVEKLQSLSARVSADARVALMANIVTLQEKIAEGSAKLAELSNASDEAWASMKAGIESTWESLKSAFGDAAAKFKE